MGVDRTDTFWRPSLTQSRACVRARTLAHTHTHTRFSAPAWLHLWPFQRNPPAHLCNKHTHVERWTQTHTSSLVQESYLLCGWLWPLAQGPSPWMCHQSFKAIKHFSMKIARSSLSKTKRSDSQSHFLPNPIKGEEGRGKKKRGWRLKMEGFYLRTMRYYRPDYSWLMFLVWEITFTIFFPFTFSLFFFWSVQALWSWRWESP